MLFAAVCIEMARSDVGFLIQPSQRTNVAGKPNSYKVQWLLHCTPLLEESAAGDGGGCTAVLQEPVPSELVMPPTETAKPITADEREQAGRLRAGAKVGARVMVTKAARDPFFVAHSARPHEPFIATIHVPPVESYTPLTLTPLPVVRCRDVLRRGSPDGGRGDGRVAGG